MNALLDSSALFFRLPYACRASDVVLDIFDLFDTSGLDHVSGPTPLAGFVD